jgi:hypothetical protein
MAAGLADALVGLLQLDFVYVRMCVPGVMGAADATRGTGWETFPGWLEGHLDAEAGEAEGGPGTESLTLRAMCASR